MASGKSRMKDKAQYLLGALTIKDAHFKTGISFVYIQSCFDTAGISRGPIRRLNTLLIPFYDKR
jgi:hypothetical protein